MPFNEDQYSRFICIDMGYSKKLCDDKNSLTRCKTFTLSFDNGSQRKSVLLLSDFNDTGKGMNIKPKVLSYVKNLKDYTKQILKVCL